jgi:hypothetical protein
MMKLVGLEKGPVAKWPEVTQTRSQTAEPTLPLEEVSEPNQNRRRRRLGRPSQSQRDPRSI